MTDSDADLPRVLLLVYACRPNVGSEPGVGWNRAVQSAKHFRTWVLCDEQYNREAIEQYLREHGPIRNLEFVFVSDSRLGRAIRGRRGMHYVAYRLWHRQAFRVGAQMHARFQFDLVHQATWNGFREPGYLWKLDAPFVWGPVGGVQNYPWKFISKAGWKGAASESLRNVLNICQLRFSRHVKRAAKKASLLLAANRTNAQGMAVHRRTNIPILLDTAITLPAVNPVHNFQHGGPLRLLWSGVFEYRKALHLLLEALAKLPASVPYELRILGRGPLEKRWRRLAQRLGVNQHCRWLGWIDHEQACEQFAWADLFVFTSLRDTTGTVVLESLAAGVPVICFNHQGAGEVVTEQCGLKLPVTYPSEVIALLSQALQHCHEHRETLEYLSEGAWTRAKSYTWDLQGEQTAKWYRQVLQLDEPRQQSTPELNLPIHSLEPAMVTSNHGGG